jgi:hypothetical protein
MFDEPANYAAMNSFFRRFLARYLFLSTFLVAKKLSSIWTSLG